jgi:hypothetical protein
VNCYMWGIAFYGVETWTLRIADQKHLESFELLCCRKTEKISWTDRVLNEEVIHRANEKKGNLHTMKRRQENWICHILH